MMVGRISGGHRRQARRSAVGRRLGRAERQRSLAQALGEDPFLSDVGLSRRFGVSVQTIRLDRLALSIPELRRRTKDVAERALRRVKSMRGGEIVGELVDLDLGTGGISILEAAPEMAFERSRVVRSQHIFAQADSLALAIVDAPSALTGLANAKFKRPVQAGDRLVAKAQVLRRKANQYVVLVETRVRDVVVFRGKFVVVGMGAAGAEAAGAEAAQAGLSAAGLAQAGHGATGGGAR